MNNPAKELARRVAARGYAYSLARNSDPLPSIEGPLLVIAPHPDDETLGCGGLIARQAASGRTVHVVYLTDGEASHRGHPILAEHHIGKMRRSEALNALAVLGVANAPEAARFLAAPDGELDRLSSERRRAVCAAIADEMRAVRPAVVCVPYRADGSSEHTAAFAMAHEAWAEVGGERMLEYVVWGWRNPLRLRPRLQNGAENFRLELGDRLAVKRRAVACYRSQVEPTPPWRERRLPGWLTTASCGRHEFYFASLPP